MDETIFTRPGPLTTRPEYGREPTLKDLVVRYYCSSGIRLDRATRLADVYIKAWLESVNTTPTPPVQQDGYAAGILAVATMIEEKAQAFADQHGSDDMGSLSFGSGNHAEAKTDYHNSLVELAEEVRAMIDAAPTPPAQPVSNADELERLRNELTDQRGVMRDLLADVALLKQRLGDAKLDAARLRKELAEASKDAARYCWLRGDSCMDHSVRWTQWEVRRWDAPIWTNDLRRADLDAAIDDAMRKEPDHAR